MVQLFESSKLTHRTPAGLPFGMTGSGEDIEITVQQAAHPARHCIASGLFINIVDCCVSRASNPEAKEL